MIGRGRDCGSCLPLQIRFLPLCADPFFVFWLFYDAKRLWGKAMNSIRSASLGVCVCMCV